MGLNHSRREVLKGTACVAMGSLLSRVLAGAESTDVAWLDEVQRPPEKAAEDSARLPALLVDDAGQPIQTLSAWQAKREALRRAWQSFLGSLGLDAQHVPALQVLEEDRVGNVTRQRVGYEIEPGLRTEAYVLRPMKLDRPAPGVAVFHSTVNHSILQPAGLGPDPEKAFGLKLAQRGCVTFSPRNFLWPDNGRIAAEAETKNFQQRHPNTTGMAKMLFDSIIATNILSKLPGVDPQRLGAVGHSLGAKEVLYLAALDDRIRATVSSEGGIGTKFSNWDAPWYLGPRIKKPEFSHEHHELLAMVAPRAFLLIGGESADGDKGWPFIAAALPVYRLYGQTPRIGQYNHRRGHAVPPECEARIYEWLMTYL